MALMRMINALDSRLTEVQRQGANAMLQIQALERALDGAMSMFKDVKRSVVELNSAVSAELTDVVGRMRNLGESPTQHQVETLACDVEIACSVLDQGTAQLVGHAT